MRWLLQTMSSVALCPELVVLVFFLPNHLQPSHFQFLSRLRSAYPPWHVSLQGKSIWHYCYWPARALCSWAFCIIVGREVLKKGIFERRMWCFLKRNNSGALPHCMGEMFEFTNISLLYITCINHISLFS